MLDIFDIKDNYTDNFADYLKCVERFCPVLDKNVIVSVQYQNGADDVKSCFNYENCKKKDSCKIIKRIYI